IRPDVIAAFLCGGEGGGQHHQASAQLTIEAFRAAADPAKYPEQIKEGLRPWQAMRVYCTDPSGFGPPGQQPLAPGLWRTDVARPPAGLTSALGAIAKDVAAARQALQTRGGAATVAPLAAGLEAVRGLRAHLSDIPETLAPIDAQGSALPWRFNHDERYEVDF